MTVSGKNGGTSIFVKNKLGCCTFIKAPVQFFFVSGEYFGRKPLVLEDDGRKQRVLEGRQESMLERCSRGNQQPRIGQVGSVRVFWAVFQQKIFFGFILAKNSIFGPGPFLRPFWCISEKVEKPELTFFHQLLMFTRVNKAYLKTRLIGATFW